MTIATVNNHIDTPGIVTVSGVSTTIKMVAETGAELTSEQARFLTDQIRKTLSIGHDLIVQAFQGRAWSALGYESWDAYCAGEFAEARMVRLDREQRREIATEMHDAGMSTTAIASGLGVSQSQVSRDLAEVTQMGNQEAPDRVTGSDGKSYPAARPNTAPSASDVPGVPEHRKVWDELWPPRKRKLNIVQRVARIVSWMAAESSGLEYAKIWTVEDVNTMTAEATRLIADQISEARDAMYAQIEYLGELEAVLHEAAE